MHKCYLLILLIVLFRCNIDTANNDKVLENNNMPTQNIITLDSISSNDTATVIKNNMILGSELFIYHCASCHSYSQIEQSSASPLGGITSRRTKEWLYAFTRNSNKMIEDSDSIAVAVYRARYCTPMTSFPDLTDAELDSIYSFIEAEYKRNKPVIRIRRVWLE